MLRTKKGFILRKMLNEHIVVAVGEASLGFNGMIRLNATGAFLWEMLEKGDGEAMREAMRRSTARRTLFDKKP